MPMQGVSIPCITWGRGRGATIRTTQVVPAGRHHILTLVWLTSQSVSTATTPPCKVWQSLIG